jgi:hypothetical protein
VAGGEIYDLTREVAWEQGIKFQSSESHGRKNVIYSYIIFKLKKRFFQMKSIRRIIYIHTNTLNNL